MPIRQMKADDYDGVYRLWIRTPGMGLNAEDDSRKGISAFLARNPNTCFVSEEAGAINGAILAGHDGRRGFIYHTAVSLEFQGRGVGTALVDHACPHWNEKEFEKPPWSCLRKTKPETISGNGAGLSAGRIWSIETKAS